MCRQETHQSISGASQTSGWFPVGQAVSGCYAVMSPAGSRSDASSWHFDSSIRTACCGEICARRSAILWIVPWVCLTIIQSALASSGSRGLNSAARGQGIVWWHSGRRVRCDRL